MYAVMAVKTWETWIAFLGHIFRQRMQLSQWKVQKGRLFFILRAFIGQRLSQMPHPSHSNVARYILASQKRPTNV